MDENNNLIEGHFPRIYDKNGDIIPGNPYYSFLDAYNCEPTAEDSPFAPKIFAEVSSNHLPYGTKVSEGINITVPRMQQRTIAKGRDFYVCGTININELIPSNAELSVTLTNENNIVVREVKCYVKDDQDHLYLDPSENKRLSKFFVDRPKNPSEIKALYDEVRLSCVPDLVCSTDKHFLNGSSVTRLDGLRCSWNKAYYTDTFFSALIYGGEYKEDDENIPTTSTWEDETLKKAWERYNEGYTCSWIDNLDKRRKKILPLSEGKYTLSVILKESSNNEKVFAQQEISINIGDIPQKIMTSFSYPNHMRNMVKIDMDSTNQETLLIDPFPGMWIRSLLGNKNIKLRLNEKEPLYFGYTINEKRGVFNNGVEYRGGNIVFYDYGISKISNAYFTEMAILLRQLNKHENISYTSVHYEYGEPNFSLYDDGLTISPNAIIPIYSKNENSLIDFTRYEISTYSTDDMRNGVYNPLISKKRCFDKTGNKIISLYKNQKIAIVGVCNLVPGKTPDLTDPFGRYIDVDRITEIVYDLVGLNGSKYTISLPVKLTRYFDKDGNPTSEKKYYSEEGKLEHRYLPKESCFEFKHVFDLYNIYELRYEKEITINCRGFIYLSSKKGYMPPEDETYCECCKIELNHK